MKIHAVQLDIVWEDRVANYQKVRELVGDASVSAGDLIVLPEMFDAGFSMNVEAAAQPDDLPSDAFVAELAAETECCVVAGVVSSSGENDLLANEVIAIAPDGAELARYRKQRPFTHGGEHTRYAPGVGHKVFDWHGAGSFRLAIGPNLAC